jgi:hypothetical protein
MDSTLYTSRGSIVLELCKVTHVLLCLEIAQNIGPVIRQQRSYLKWQKLNGQEGSQKYCMCNFQQSNSFSVLIFTQHPFLVGSLFI